MNYEEQLKTLLDKSYGEIDMTWDEICDEFGLDISPITLAKSWNSLYGGKAVYEYFKDRNLEPSQYASDEQIKRLEQIKDELYKERVKLQDQRKEWNKILREEARFEHLKEVMFDAISGLEPIDISVKEFDIKNDGVEAALLISDIHLGLLIDTPLNYYDVDVAKQRLVQLAEKTSRYCKLHNVSKLNVCIIGDCINGIIQQSSRCDQEEDAISQLMTFCELMTNVISYLRQNVDDIVVYSTFGNHERIVANKKESVNRENFGRLVPFYLKARLVGLKIVDSHGVDYIEATIGGMKTIMTHGDKDSWNTAGTDFASLLGYMPQQVFLGHTHDFHNADVNNVDVIVNGCVDGCNEYAMTLRKFCKPHQVLRIYDNDTCTYKLTLD